jgi:hypothetical protein
MCRPISIPKIHFGIGEDGWWYYPLNQPIKFPLICVDKNEKNIGGQAKVEIIKHEYRTVLRKTDSYFRYESQQEDKLVASNTVSISGENSNYIYPRTPAIMRYRYQYRARAAM